MTPRQKRIWDLLSEQESLTSGQIAKLLHISDRTVRNDIKEINQENRQEVIQAVKGQGYSIKASLDRSAAYGETADNQEDLEWQVVRRVLFDDRTPYLELADELYVSDALLAKLVSRINVRMSRQYGHENRVIRKQNGLLVLELPEQEKREYYHFYVTTRNLNHYYDWKAYEPFFEYADLPGIADIVLKETGSGDYRFYDTTIMRLMIHTAILAERWSCGYVLPQGEREAAMETAACYNPEQEKASACHNPEQEKVSACHNPEQEKASACYNPEQEKVSDCHNPEQEKTAACHILNQIKGHHRIELELPAEEYRDYEQVFQNDFYYIKDGNAEQTKDLLHQILIEISVEYGFDFTKNEEFCDEMMAQLNGTQLRARKKQYVVNPVLAQMKSKYPLEYDIAIFFADRFRRLTGMSISEDEVGQIAVHFIWGMEAGFEKMQQKLALINPYGKQTDELIERRLEKTGECHPTIAYQYSIFNYPGKMPMDAVAVLSTIPLARPPEDIPVVLCRNFLDYHEKEKLLTIIRESQVSSIKGYFRTLFKPSLFFCDVEFESRESALAFMCEKLHEQGYVKEGFLDSVMQRERIAPTAFEPGFAFSHGVENNAIGTAVCTCILKHKIPWGPYQVKIVFLFALAPSWNHTIIPVYNVMIDHLFQTSTIHRLSKIKDCRTFLDLLL